MNQNITLSITTIIFSIFFLVMSLQLPPAKTNGQIGPGDWPTWILVLMLILSIILLGRSILQKKKISTVNEIEEEKISGDGQEGENHRKHWYVVAILCLYLLMLPFLGFFVSTVIFIVVLTWFFGMKKWRNIILTAFLGGIIFTYVFVTALNLPLPRGKAIFHGISLFFQ